MSSPVNRAGCIGVIRGKMEAAQTGECDLTNLGLAPSPHNRNGG